MERILTGVRTFRSAIFPKQQGFFEHLAGKQQKPLALFITCADSRVIPNLVTQTEPGDLFLIRNAGNLVPAYNAASGGEGATIEYAVAVLGIKNIILCGHSDCGAMRALLEPSLHSDLPAVSQWFTHAESTRRIVAKKYSELQGLELLRAATEENILVQMNNLSTHPSVAVRLSLGELHVYGWYYDIATGAIFQYDQSSGVFHELDGSAVPAAPLPIRGSVVPSMPPPEVLLGPIAGNAVISEAS